MTDKERIRVLRLELLEFRNKNNKLNNLLGHVNDHIQLLMKELAKHEQWFQDRTIIMDSYELPYLWEIRRDSLDTLDIRDYREEEDQLITENE